jgi:hypothetical protein
MHRNMHNQRNGIRQIRAKRFGYLHLQTKHHIQARMKTKDARDYIPRKEIETEIKRLKDWVALAKEGRKESPKEYEEAFKKKYSAIDINKVVQAHLKRLQTRKMETDHKKSKWGEPQKWGILTIRYKPTGEIKKMELGIRMNYNNELIFCEAWGYDKGYATDLNHPDNYEVISIEPYKK